MVTEADMPAIAAMRKKNGAGSLGGPPEQATPEAVPGPVGEPVSGPLLGQSTQVEDPTKKLSSLDKLNKIVAMYGGGLGTM